MNKQNFLQAMGLCKKTTKILWACFLSCVIKKSVENVPLLRIFKLASALKGIPFKFLMSGLKEDL